MKSYRLSSTFVTVDLLLNNLLPFLKKNSFPHFYFILKKTEIMVAVLNLLGSVGDLYYLCNTLSMLVLPYFGVHNFF